MGTVLVRPTESGLQPEGLHPARGVAASGFRPLRKIPTAASRRSLGRVSVPVWLIVLSDQLPVDALVGRYRHKLIAARLSRSGIHFFTNHAIGEDIRLALLSEGYPGLRGRFLTCYSPVRH